MLAVIKTVVLAECDECRGVQEFSGVLYDDAIAAAINDGWCLDDGNVLCGNCSPPAEPHKGA